MVKMLSSQAEFESHLVTHKNGVTCANYNNFYLRTAFQPIYNRQLNLVAVEAFLRVTDVNQDWVNPAALFAPKVPDTDEYHHQVNMDRLARVLHFRNFSLLRSPIQLFVNLLPSTAVANLQTFYGQKLMLTRLKQLGIEANQVVIEVLEHEVPDDYGIEELRASIRISKENGIRIAVDDYGVDGSNEFRVQSLLPDILKIDRTILEQYIQGDTTALVRGISLANQIGSQVVVEGIETQQQLLAMMELNVHLFQGYYLAHPKIVDETISSKTYLRDFDLNQMNSVAKIR